MTWQHSFPSDPWLCSVMHCKSCERCIINASKHWCVGGWGGGERGRRRRKRGAIIATKACVKSLNMSQLGWRRSDQPRAPPSIGSPTSPVHPPRHSSGPSRTACVIAEKSANPGVLFEDLTSPPTPRFLFFETSNPTRVQ